MGAGEAAASAAVEATVRYHSGDVVVLTLATSEGTAAGGEFDWGGRLLKSNGGAQWFPQAGGQSAGARKGNKGA